MLYLQKLQLTEKNTFIFTVVHFRFSCTASTVVSASSTDDRRQFSALKNASTFVCYTMGVIRRTAGIRLRLRQLKLVSFCLLRFVTFVYRRRPILTRNITRRTVSSDPAKMRGSTSTSVNPLSLY